MKRFISQLLILSVLLLLAPSAFAQATRTWISGVGDDANPCSRTAPCKTFAGAISKTATGGEIDVLDPGGFGAVTITKPITLDGGAGQVGSILAAGTNGVVINITTAPTGPVILRNLSINGIASSVSPGLNGVRYLAGSQVLIEHCTIMGFTQKGIDVALTAPGSITVRDTSITQAATGFSLATTSGTAFGTLLNSTISFSSTAGVVINSGVLNAESNMFANNTGTAVLPTAGVIRLSNNDLFNNGLGVGTGSGTVVSAGNNRKAGNGTGSLDATITTF